MSAIWQSLLRTLISSPDLLKLLDLRACTTFIELIQLLKPVIKLHQPPEIKQPLDHLPRYIHQFLSACLCLNHEDTKQAWQLLRFLAWEQPDLTAAEHHSYGSKYIPMFLKHGGPDKGIAFYHFLPRHKSCIDPACQKASECSQKNLQERLLVEQVSVPVTVFTQDFGPIPGITCSMYCRKCKTRYHPDYWIQNASSSSPQRTYYRAIYDFIQIADHVYIEARLCELFSTMMLTSWTSASNCARIYNDGLASKLFASALPASFSKSLLLDLEDVWNSLCMYWLLEDCFEQGVVLRLAEKMPSQAKRIQEAMIKRNERMVGPGQDEWSHACDLCCWTERDENGDIVRAVRSVVTDGVTIGRPCCSVHDCKEPLLSVKDRFCLLHQSEMSICCVTTSDSKVQSGFKTCSLKEHRSLETYIDERNKAMFQLKDRLQRLKTSQPVHAIPPNPNVLQHDDEEVLVDAAGICNSDKSELGNVAPKARFGRRRTHNEELCVASCGLILGRATFYASEAPSSVVAFWKRLFPTPQSLPDVLWHDNNCRVSAMLRARKDTYFQNCALPVDVFHFKSKHKESDVECGRYCNPALWPDLQTPEGGWRFNSSAAEQANAWIGGYQAIVREMQMDRYEFFLDEMIKRRNKILIRDLKAKGHAPYNIPKDLLLTTRID